MYLKQDIKEQLLTKKPIDLLFQLSIPAVIGMIVIGLYPLMDGIFAGKIIGQTAMTACGVANASHLFYSGIFNLAWCRFCVCPIKSNWKRRPENRR